MRVTGEDGCPRFTNEGQKKGGPWHEAEIVTGRAAHPACEVPLAAPHNGCVAWPPPKGPRLSWPGPAAHSAANVAPPLRHARSSAQSTILEARSSDRPSWGLAGPRCIRRRSGSVKRYSNKQPKVCSSDAGQPSSSPLICPIRSVMRKSFAFSVRTDTA